jgi:transposase-like protein
MKGERRLLGEWMLQDTNSNVEVARALGVSRELVRKWRKALGLPPVAKELSRRIDGVGVQNNQ